MRVRNNAAAKVHSKPPKPPAGATVDLGKVGTTGMAGPAATMANKTFTLKAGDTLKFQTDENQIWNIATIKTQPANALSVQRKIVVPRDPTKLGSCNTWATQISVPANAKSGTVIPVTVSAGGVGTSNPQWNYTFNVKVM